VFAGDVAGGRLSNVEELCPNLCGDFEALRGSEIILPDYKADERISLRASISFLKSIVGPGAEVDIPGVEQEQKLDVRWQNVREFSYTSADQWLATGEPRPIEKRCRSAIDDLKVKNRFKDRVFVITRAVAPESVSYDFKRALSGDIRASGETRKVLEAFLDANAQFKNRTLIDVQNKRVYVGYARPMKIQEWAPSGLVSGEIVSVKAIPSDVIIGE